MAPAAARRAAAAAVRHVAAAPPRAAAIHPAGAGAASIHPSGPRAASIHLSGPRAAGSAAIPTAGSRAAVTHPSGPRAAAILPAGPRAAAILPAGPRAAAIRPAGPRASTHPSAVTTTQAFSSFAAGHLPTRFSLSSGRLTGATAPTGLRFLHLLAARPIPPHIQLELSRLDARQFGRYKEIAEALQLLGQKLAEEQFATLQYMTEQVIHIGTVSWRVCTTVLTVAVAAGIGVLQLSKSEWEREFDEAACSLIISRLAQTTLELDELIVKEITERRSVAAAKVFLGNQRTTVKALELVEREEALVAREEALVAREAALGPK